MSHTLAARCETHEVFMYGQSESMGCPERGCPGNHGWTDIACPGEGSCPAVPITITVTKIEETGER